MALSASALVTLDEARLWVHGSADDDSQDQLLELLIESYSSAIARYTGRELLPKTPALDTDPIVTRTFRYAGSGVLDFVRFELRPLNLGSIVLYSDLPSGSQRTLSAGSSTEEAEYRLEPREQTPEGTYLRLILPELDVPASRRAKGVEVSVSGRWGAGTVPADVKLACLIAVRNAARNPEGFASRSLGELTFSEGPAPPESLSLPRDARGLLAPHRRSALLP